MFLTHYRHCSLVNYEWWVVLVIVIHVDRLWQLLIRYPCEFVWWEMLSYCVEGWLGYAHFGILCGVGLSFVGLDINIAWVEGL